MAETSIEQARAAILAARDAYRNANAGRRAAVFAVEAEWQPAIDAAVQAKRDAVAALAAAESAAAPDHVWTGKKVFRVELTYHPFSRRPNGEKRYEGVVETYRPGANLGRGHYVYIVGAPIVRYLKKDGTPGAKTEDLERRLGGDWQLAEPTPSKPEEAK